MKNRHKLKIGLFGIGLDAYWPQFAGLKERLEGYLEEVEKKLRIYDADIVNLGLIDNPVKALDAGHEFRRLGCLGHYFGGALMLLVAGGESAPGPILEIGNTNSRYRFPIGIKNFVNTWNSNGPAHHCAGGVGHIASTIEKLGELLEMEVVKVC